MATLVLRDLNQQIVSDYEIASAEEKSQLHKVIADILELWAHRHPLPSRDETLWQDMLEFMTNPQTFPLDWQHNKLNREEMNAR